VVSKSTIAILLIVALVLSVTATYITITNFNQAPTPISAGNQANVGLYVPPTGKANVGVTVIPAEEETGDSTE